MQQKWRNRSHPSCKVSSWDPKRSHQDYIGISEIKISTIDFARFNPWLPLRLPASISRRCCQCTGHTKTSGKSTIQCHPVIPIMTFFLRSFIPTTQKTNTVYTPLLLARSISLSRLCFSVLISDMHYLNW